METLIVKQSDIVSNARLISRQLTEEQWINQHASGTLRKAKHLGFAYRHLYLEERICYEYGWGFSIQPKSRVQLGDALIEGDMPPLTEACWHIERYITLNPFPNDDIFSTKYLTITAENNIEGIGLVCTQTSANWIPSGHLIFAVITEYSKEKEQWMPAQNPF